jgi:hypothetical protein
VKSKFVLGIVVVLSLQIFYQVFNALERTDDRYFRVGVTTQVASPTGTSPVELAAIPEGENGSEDQTLVTNRAVVKTAPATVRTQFASIRPEHKPLFETITITYPARPATIGSPLTPAPRQANAEVRTERPQENDRSLLARAVVPVVKKPYEFLKLLGSKLR